MKSRAASWSALVCLSPIVAMACFGAEPKILEPSEVALEFDQRSWQHEHGLPAGDRVHAILQTRDGYLWIGSQYGLARFDGSRFTVFNHVNTPELSSDDCRTLAEDVAGNLWIGTREGLFQKSGNRFTPFANKLGSFVVAYPPLCASRTGGVWVGGRGSVCRIRDGRVKIYSQDQRMPMGPGVVTCLEEDEAGFVWIGSETGFARLDVKGERFEISETNTGVEHLPVFAMRASVSGERWILFAEFLPKVPSGPMPRTWIARLEPGQWPKAPIAREQRFPSGWYGHFLVEDHDGALWLPGGLGGILRYRSGALEFLPVLHRGKDDFALSALPDREGNLWVGTDKGGLQRWTPRKVSTYSTGDGLAHDNVWSIWEARDGRVLIGTDGGVTQFKEGRGNTFKRPDGSVHEDVRAVVEDLEGAIWVGTMRSLECISNGVSRQIELPGEWFETKIRALQPGRDGSMWVGTVRGLTRLYQGDRTKYTKADGLGSDEVRAILEDRAGVLWVGTLGGGLSRWHNGQFTTLTTTNGLSSNNVWALHEDSDGMLWIGTDNGLNCFDKGHTTAFTKADGLPDSLVNFIVSDHFGRLWIGHDRGIYAVEKQDLKEVARKERSSVRAVQYDESDGLLGTETNGQKSNPAACKTRDGRLWLPTTQGVAIVEPAKVVRRGVPPLAAIEEVRANGEQVFGDRPQARSSSDSNNAGNPRVPVLRFAPGEARVLEFHYTANTFVAPEKARFKYRLVGVDYHWIDADTQRRACFTDLRPGDYQFELIACNHHGLWQEKGVTVAFHVAPFYYQTWWFYAVCGAGAAVLLGSAAGWRVREARRINQLERMNALNEQRRRIARDIHDELGASLTRIAQLSSSKTPRQLTVTGKTEERSQRIAHIAEEAVDSIGGLVWANDPEYDTLEDLVAYLREYAANYLVECHMHVRFDLPETMPLLPVTGLCRRNLVMLVKEALQNVSKHAGAKNVNIRMAVEDGVLELDVKDDGQGILASPRGRPGNGLVNMRERVAELQGQIEVDSQPGRGTKVQVRVPLK